MARNVATYLQDIFDACVAIEEVTQGVSLDEYRNKRSIRSAVEREFIIIGEALSRVRTIDEILFKSASNSRAIVDFRNILAHNYGAIDDEAVFGLVYSDLKQLKAEIDEVCIPDLRW